MPNYPTATMQGNKKKIIIFKFQYMHMFDKKSIEFMKFLSHWFVWNEIVDWVWKGNNILLIYLYDFIHKKWAVF